MLDRVYMAESDAADAEDYEIFVAAPVIVADCVVRTERELFASHDPFQRGLLLFLLAGVTEKSELATLLGIKDEAFVDLMIDELKNCGMARTTPGGVSYTERARKEFETVGSAPAREQRGRVFYGIPDGRTRFIAGPLTLEARLEEVEELEDGVHKVGVGTQGRPRFVTCLLPDIPGASPMPMRSSDATEGAQTFIRAARGRTTCVHVQHGATFSLTLSQPYWARLLTRVLPVENSAPKVDPERESDDRRGMEDRPRADFTAFAARGLRSPSMRDWLKTLTAADRKFGAAFHRELRNRSPLLAATRKTPTAKTLPTPHQPDDSTSGTIPAVAVDVSLRALLTSALSARLQELAIGVHVPLIDDRSHNEKVLRERLSLVGFVMENDTGIKDVFPTLNDRQLAIVRSGDWDLCEHLWVAFCAWTFVERPAHLTDIASLIPRLPRMVADLHWQVGHIDGHELQWLIDHLKTLVKD